MTNQTNSPTKSPRRGVIAWMAYNRVTPNLLMIVLLIAGVLTSNTIKKEVFPNFELDIVRVNVAYPGASPEEIEKGIIQAIEENIQGLDGIDCYRSIAKEGVATVNIELLAGSDHQQVFQDIQQEIDRITTFPEDSEEPIVNIVQIKRDVLQVTLYGDVGDHALREIAEFTKDRLLQEKDISQVAIIGALDFEIAVEVSQQNLRKYGLTISEIATKIDQSSLEIPSGKIKTSNGEILLRVRDRSDWANEFARIPIITTANGSVVYLEEIATVYEAFEDTNRSISYQGKNSIALGVSRVGKETPISISEATHLALEEIQKDFPAAIEWTVNRDRSKMYQERLELLLKNAFIGLALVLVLLGTFLEFRLACWVTMGIPTAFLGAMLFLPIFGISINMISMFAFIVALGIVVDDAIIAGENIYEYRQRGHDFVEAAILGARDVAIPITFAILTNIVAFAPLLFVPGTIGKIWGVIPTVVITVFVISWVEAVLILPAHLAHGSRKKPTGILRLLDKHNKFFTGLLKQFIDNAYLPFLKFCLRWRTVTVALGIALFIASIGYVKGGRIAVIMMPRVESDRSVVTVTYPLGTPLAEVKIAKNRLEDSISRLAEKHGGTDLLEGVFAKIIDNELQVTAYLASPDVRPMSTKKITKLWRQETGNITGPESILFESDKGGPGSGSALSIELSHRNIDTLDVASAELAAKLSLIDGTKDISDGFSQGKQQIDFQITEAGKALGLTNFSIGRQLRDSFQGNIALRQQRGRNEMTVRVRLPENERLSEHNIDIMMVKTPNGTFIPLLEVAEVERGRAYTTIKRRNGKRVVTVTGNVDPIGKVDVVMNRLNADILPNLVKQFPGLAYSYQGRQADKKESFASIADGFVYALLGIYVLLAIPFRSYIQPVIVMFAIPFGLIGALIGHVLMGYNLSIMSIMGILALSGVIVNDSLVLVDYANKKVRDGVKPAYAIAMAGQRRFRPIILTTLTTFGGLAPMIFETSRQARFMIPMAISLGFGILFVTVIALLLVPCFYLLVEDTKDGITSLKGLLKKLMWKQTK
ncbi:MAG: efflux RND transporter permease subunit [Desulfotalea sp.]